MIAYPGEVTRLRAKFDNPGQFVWHCHIVEHEDNEMMRPYRIGPVQRGEPRRSNQAEQAVAASPETISKIERGCSSALDFHPVLPACGSGARSATAQYSTPSQEPLPELLDRG